MGASTNMNTLKKVYTLCAVVVFFGKISTQMLTCLSQILRVLNVNVADYRAVLLKPMKPQIVQTVTEKIAIPANAANTKLMG